MPETEEGAVTRVFISNAVGTVTYPDGTIPNEENPDGLQLKDDTP